MRDCKYVASRILCTPIHSKRRSSCWLRKKTRRNWVASSLWQEFLNEIWRANWWKKANKSELSELNKSAKTSLRRLSLSGRMFWRRSSSLKTEKKFKKQKREISEGKRVFRDDLLKNAQILLAVNILRSENMTLCHNRCTNISINIMATCVSSKDSRFPSEIRQASPNLDFFLKTKKMCLTETKRIPQNEILVKSPKESKKVHSDSKRS